MWIVLIFTLSSEPEPFYADRYYPTQEACMAQANGLFEEYTNITKVVCIDPNDIDGRRPELTKTRHP